MKIKVLLLILTVLCIHVSPAFATSNIQLEISLNQYAGNLIFGFNQDATNGFDELFDRVVPPQPPKGLYCYIVNEAQESYLSKLSKSVVKPVDEYTWEAHINTINTEGILHITWEQTQTQGTHILIINNQTIDMSENNEYTQVIQPSEELILCLHIITNNTPQDSTTPEETNETATNDTSNETKPNTDEIKEPIYNETQRQKENNTAQTEETTQSNQEPLNYSIELSSNKINSGETTQLQIRVENPSNSIREYSIEIRIDSNLYQQISGEINPRSVLELTRDLQLEDGVHKINVNNNWASVTVAPKYSVGFQVWPIFISILIFILITKKFKS